MDFNTSRSSSSELAMDRFLVDKSGRPPDTSRSSSSELAMDRFLMDKTTRRFLVFLFWFYHGQISYRPVSRTTRCSLVFHFRIGHGSVLDDEI